MTKPVVVFAVTALLAVSVAAEDTVRDRLTTIDRFGVQAHDGTLAVTLHAYTGEQYEDNVADLTQYEIRKLNHELEKDEHRRRFQTATEHFNTDRSQEALEQLRALQSGGPKALTVSRFASAIRLYKKVSLGKDYLTLQPHENEASEILIPLSQIGRIVFTRALKRPEVSTSPVNVDEGG